LLACGVGRREKRCEKKRKDVKKREM
jgi:hypothetical protein